MRVGNMSRKLFFSIIILTLLFFILFNSIYVQAQNSQWYLIKVIDRPIYDSRERPGKAYLFVDIFKLYNDGNTQRDWYMIKVRIQMVPGIIAYGAESWRNVYCMHRHYVSLFSSQNYLVAYAPTTTVGSTTVGWEINIGIGAIGRIPVPLPQVGWVFSQTSSDVKVYDYSDFKKNIAHWRFNINPHSDPGSHTFLTESAYIIMVPEGAIFQILMYYEVLFRDIFWQTPGFNNGYIVISNS
jgi:hypothetical protein